MRGVRKTELIETIHKLNQRITQLEQVVNQLSRPVIEQVTIERVYLQNPVLERLEFGLESIDIKELSGALNLGNNFGVSVEPLQNKKRGAEPKSKQGNTSQQEEKNIEGIAHKVDTERYTKEKTASGFRFKVN